MAFTEANKTNFLKGKGPKLIGLFFIINNTLF